MTASHDTTVVLRLPQDLKQLLQDEAAAKDVSLSELIRLKLIAEHQRPHREPHVRIGETTVRLDQVIRPDMLVWEDVEESEPTDEPSARMMDAALRMSDVARQMMRDARRVRNVVWKKEGAERIQADGRHRSERSGEIRAIIASARAEAKRLRCDWVGTEHLLLGIIARQKSTARGLISARADLDAMRTRIDEDIRSGGLTGKYISGESTLTRQAVRAIDSAARRFAGATLKGGDDVRLLLALVSNPEFLSARILEEFGVVQAELEQAVEYEPATAVGTATDIMRSARELVIERGDLAMSPEHLLYAVLDHVEQHRSNEQAKTVALSADEVAAIRSDVVEVLGPAKAGQRPSETNRPVRLDKRCEAVMRRLGSLSGQPAISALTMTSAVNATSILLALHDAGGAAAEILTRQGVSRDRLRG